VSNRLAINRDDGVREVASDRAGISDIAWLAGVPRRTISQAIEGAPQARAEARQAILAFLRDAGEGPAQRARIAAVPKPALIGLIYDAPNPERVVGWQDGMMDALTATRGELAIRRVNAESPWLFDEVRAFIQGQKLDGVALASPLSLDERLVAMIQGLGVRYAAIAPSPSRGARREGRAAGERLTAPRNG
jgi:LacI family transcriptional regulator